MEEGLSKYYHARWAVMNLADTSSSTFNRRHTAQSVVLVLLLHHECIGLEVGHHYQEVSPIAMLTVVGKGRWNHQQS